MNAPGPLTCPRCGIPLFGSSTTEVVLHGCGRCCGLWLDNRACQLLVTDSLGEAARDLIHNATLRTPREQAAGGYRRRALPADAACPVCAEPLTPHATEEKRHGKLVNLDVCAAHGTWFDRGEAWSLLQAISLKSAAASLAVEMALRDAHWSAQNEAWNAFVGTTHLRTR